MSAAALAGMSDEEWPARVAAMPDTSIYDEDALAQPDEVWNFGRGRLRKGAVVANVARSRGAGPCA